MKRPEEIFEEGDRVVAIYYDQDPTNPRSWYNAAVLWCWHSRYNLGDDDPDKPREPDLKELREELEADEDVLVVRPLFLMDSLSISLEDFRDRWDSGCVGIAFVRASRLKDLGWADKDITFDAAVSALEGEVETYDEYVSNATYCYEVYVGGHEDGEGMTGTYFGHDHTKSGLLVDAFGDAERAARAKRVTDLDGARARTRKVFEAAEHPTVVRFPQEGRPGAFSEYPFKTVAEARAFLAPWYADEDEQNLFFKVVE